ncbi:hypothetical protein HHL19_08800 [Streptomyces sp. R302]|uniref:hypothetical protein n=1 Tax=unclassified Streptomyces TaxID=2593676 RepID=UPI00145F9333|nr:MULTISPECIES: hypothetical protein [unclassified Streptomyces]NML52928.1 hypothetical protein [Streptomyces sp. R301]NML78763.1 hypothetical protein [Streptomyces sp. R302]
MLSEEDILAAVRRSLGAAGADPTAFPADGARITRHLLVDGEIVRSVETREERPGFHPGSRDLSDRPEYDDLDGYAIPAPADPGNPSTLLLVRRGTVDPRPCVCANGRRQCARCEGAGDLKCPPYVPCGGCEGRLCCLSCEGTGKPALKAADRPQGETATRVRCRECGAEDAACEKCRGAGRKKCGVCRGSGTRPCPVCKREGTIAHDYCEGTGRYVRWTEGVVDRRPVVDAFEETSSLPARAFAWTRESDGWEHIDTAHEIPDMDAGIAAFLKPRLGFHDGEVGRRVRVRHLSLARVTHDDHPHRVYVVVPGQVTPRVVAVRSPRRTLQLALLALLVLVATFTAARLVS